MGKSLLAEIEAKARNGSGALPFIFHLSTLGRVSSTPVTSFPLAFHFLSWGININLSCRNLPTGLLSFYPSFRSRSTG
uniref:Uncharacterized protein n=1 Tax=Sphaerodactylus townsendi TaxID=933632 RepID=A0ACB8EBB5_9SAUR